MTHGRCVAFRSYSDNLVAGDSNAAYDAANAGGGDSGGAGNRPRRGSVLLS
jgi:hypothetical protein